PAVPHAGPVQRPLEYGIGVKLPSAELLLQDRPDFHASGILFISCALEGKLGNQSQVQRKMPRLRNVKMRQQAPAGVVRSPTARTRRPQEKQRDFQFIPTIHRVSDAKCYSTAARSGASGARSR